MMERSALQNLWLILINRKLWVCSLKAKKIHNVIIIEFCQITSCLDDAISRKTGSRKYDGVFLQIEQTIFMLFLNILSPIIIACSSLSNNLSSKGNNSGAKSVRCLIIFASLAITPNFVLFTNLPKDMFNPSSWPVLHFLAFTLDFSFQHHTVSFCINLCPNVMVRFVLNRVNGNTQNVTERSCNNVGKCTFFFENHSRSML